MKKIFMIITLLTFGLVLQGCGTEDSTDVTAPSFVGISIDETNPHNGSELVTFYKERNEIIEVEVTLSNPDNLEIRSIVIDGYYYRHTRFTSDSTNEVIKFEIQAGDELGEHIYSVDDIEYFDGADVKTELVSENNLFEISVYKNKPVVSWDDVVTTSNSISIWFDVTDDDNVIEEGTLIAEIFAGDNVLPQSYELTSGEQVIEFTGLLSNKSYTVKVRGNYDLDNSQGLQELQNLYTENFLTELNARPKVLIDDIDVNGTEATLYLDITNEDNTIVPAGLRVILRNVTTTVPDRTFVIDDTVETFVIGNLLNNNEYEVFIEADYDLRDGLFTQTLVLTEEDFITGVKERPVPEVDNLLVEENKISFDLLVDDPDGIIYADSLIAELYIDGSTDPYSTHRVDNYNAEFEIFNILSGFDFEIRIVGDYNLQDGSADVTGVVLNTFFFSTNDNLKPEIIIHEKIVQQGYIIFDIEVSDVNDTLKGNIIANLIEDDVVIDTLILTAESDRVEFKQPISYEKNYSVEFLAEYDLRDGQNIRDLEVLKKVVLPSFEPLPPAAEIENASASKTGLSFDITVLDADSTIIPGSVEVIFEKEGYPTITLPMNDLGTLGFSIDTLLSNNEYKITVVADYNVNRNSDVVEEGDIQENQILLQTYLTTLPKSLPTITISNPVVTKDTVTIDILVNDNDEVTIDGTVYAQLYKNGETVGDAWILTEDALDPTIISDTVLFDEDILSDNSYDIVVFTNYYLNDDGETVIKYELGSYTVKTEDRAAPSASIQNLTAGTDSLTMDIIVTDTDAVITGNLKVVLYIGENPYLLDNGDPYEIELNATINPAISFTDIYTDQDYYLKVVTDYDLKDGATAVTEDLLAFDFAKTGTNIAPTGEIFNVIVGIDSISFYTLVEDPDLVITGGLEAIIYRSNGEIQDTITVNPGIDDTNVFTNLPSDQEYTIRLYTNYDLGVISGGVREELDVYTTSTRAYTQPEGVVTNLTKGIDYLEFDVLTTDSDNTSVELPDGFHYYVELYENGSPVANTYIGLNEGYVQDIRYDGLKSGIDYEIRVYINYDLKDGYEDILYYYSKTETTIAKKLPEGFADSLVITNEVVSFTFNYLDEDSVIVNGSPLVAELWAPHPISGDLTLISSHDLSTDEVTFDITGFIADYDFEVRIMCEIDLSTGGTTSDYKCLDLQVSTPANLFPQVIISNVSINQNDVTAHIDVEDIDDVIIGNLFAIIENPAGDVISTIALTEGLNEVAFPVILDNDILYSVQVIADYNMKDASGTVTAGTLKETQILFFNLLVPEAEYSNVVITDESIEFDVTIYDNDTTYIGNARAVLYENGVPVDTFMLNNPAVNAVTHVTFDTNLISDYDYEVVFYIDYNNQNNTGVTYNYEMLRETFHVEAKEVPTAVIDNEVLTSSSITFDVTITDNDSIITEDVYAYLYAPYLTEPVALLIPSNGTYVYDTDIYSNTTYDIVIRTSYDKEDLSDPVIDATLVTKTVKTVENHAPEAAISNVRVDSESILFDLDLTDVDSVIAEDQLYARLYLNGLPTNEFILLDEELTSFTDLEFDGLFSNAIYTVNIEADYDLHDGINNLDDAILINTTVTTDANDIPLGYITYTASGYDTITFLADIRVDDTVITNNLKAILVLDGTPVPGQEIPLDYNNLTYETFNGVLSNETYEIKIVVDYDLNDGNGEETDYTLVDASVATVAKQSPSATITDKVITNRSISFNAEVFDVASTIQSGLVAKLYKDGVDQNVDVTLTSGSVTAVSFNDLEVGADYSIVIEALYNNNIGNADEIFVLSTFDDTTRDIIIIDGITNDPLEVNIDLFIDDYFDILVDGNINVIIYDELNNLVADSFFVEVNTPSNTVTVDILNYYNNHQYTIYFEALLDDGGSGTVETLYTMDLQTEQKVLQYISLDPIGVNGTQIATGVSIVLPDSEYGLINGDVYAKLYVWNDATSQYDYLEQVLLVNGDNTIVFSGYDGTDGTQYKVTIEALCDWNEYGLGNTMQIIDQRTFLYTEQTPAP